MWIILCKPIGRKWTWRNCDVYYVRPECYEQVSWFVHCQRGIAHCLVHYVASNETDLDPRTITMY